MSSNPAGSTTTANPASTTSQTKQPTIIQFNQKFNYTPTYIPQETYLKSSPVSDHYRSFSIPLSSQFPTTSGTTTTTATEKPPTNLFSESITTPSQPISSIATTPSQFTFPSNFYIPPYTASSSNISTDFSTLKPISSPPVSQVIIGSNQQQQSQSSYQQPQQQQQKQHYITEKITQGYSPSIAPPVPPSIPISKVNEEQQQQILEGQQNSLIQQSPVNTSFTSMPSNSILPSPKTYGTPTLPIHKLQLKQNATAIIDNQNKSPISIHEELNSSAFLRNLAMSTPTSSSNKANSSFSHLPLPLQSTQSSISTFKSAVETYIQANPQQQQHSQQPQQQQQHHQIQQSLSQNEFSYMKSPRYINGSSTPTPSSITHTTTTTTQPIILQQINQSPLLPQHQSMPSLIPIPSLSPYNLESQQQQQHKQFPTASSTKDPMSYISNTSINQNIDKKPIIEQQYQKPSAEPTHLLSSPQRLHNKYLSFDENSLHRAANIPISTTNTTTSPFATLKKEIAGEYLPISPPSNTAEQATLKSAAINSSSSNQPLLDSQSQQQQTHLRNNSMNFMNNINEIESTSPQKQSFEISTTTTTPSLKHEQSSNSNNNNNNNISNSIQRIPTLETQSNNLSTQQKILNASPSDSSKKGRHFQSLAITPIASSSSASQTLQQQLSSMHPIPPYTPTITSTTPTTLPNIPASTTTPPTSTVTPTPTNTTTTPKTDVFALYQSVLQQNNAQQKPATTIVTPQQLQFPSYHQSFISPKQPQQQEDSQTPKETNKIPSFTNPQYDISTSSSLSKESYQQQSKALQQQFNTPSPQTKQQKQVSQHQPQLLQQFLYQQQQTSSQNKQSQQSSSQHIQSNPIVSQSPYKPTTQPSPMALDSFSGQKTPQNLINSPTVSPSITGQQNAQKQATSQQLQPNSSSTYSPISLTKISSNPSLGSSNRGQLSGQYGFGQIQKTPNLGGYQQPGYGAQAVQILLHKSPSGGIQKSAGVMKSPLTGNSSSTNSNVVRLRSAQSAVSSTSQSNYKQKIWEDILKQRKMKQSSFHTPQKEKPANEQNSSNKIQSNPVNSHYDSPEKKLPQQYTQAQLLQMQSQQQQQQLPSFNPNHRVALNPNGQPVNSISNSRFARIVEIPHMYAPSQSTSSLQRISPLVNAQNTSEARVQSKSLYEINEAPKIDLNLVNNGGESVRVEHTFYGEGTGMTFSKSKQAGISKHGIYVNTRGDTSDVASSGPNSPAFSNTQSHVFSNSNNNTSSAPTSSAFQNSVKKVSTFANQQQEQIPQALRMSFGGESP